LPKFFLPKEKVNIEKHYLEMWPGYETAAKSYIDGIFLNVDTATKFINKETVIEQVYDMLDKRYSKKDIEDHYSPAMNKDNRMVIITQFNSKSYQIDGLTFSSSPEAHTFSWELYDPKTKTREKQKTNMVEYYKIKYGITIKDTRQPLLFINKND
jgi:hypothetical protein